MLEGETYTLNLEIFGYRCPLLSCATLVLLPLDASKWNQRWGVGHIVGKG